MTDASDRRLASRVAARTQIRDVRLWRSTVGLNAVPRGDESLGYNFEVLDSSVDWDDGDDNFVVRIDYGVEVSQQTQAIDDSEESDADEPASIASLNFTMAALFTIILREGDEPTREDEVLAYARSTGAFALYPFVREYVYDVTGRLGLPSLTLGVSTIPVTQDEEI